MPLSKADLRAHITKLKAKEATKPQVADDALLFWGSFEDKAYLPHLKGCVGSAVTYVRIENVDTISQVVLHCHSKKVTRVVSTSISLLMKLLKWDKKAKPSLSNYAGSYFSIPTHDGKGEIEIVFIASLKQLSTVAYGKFMATRIISKLTKPDTWYQPTEFTGFKILDASNEADIFDYFEWGASLISVDIETFKDNATIRCLSYTGFFFDGNRQTWSSQSVVLPMDSEYNLAIMRKWNWQLKAPKVFQNGKYDIAYLSRYSAPVYNYIYDTAHLFHCYYSELPKDLGFLNSFLLRKAMYWKDLSETNDLYEYYRYNALDTWGTGNAFLAMLLEAPAYAIDNYLLEFPLVFPCHMCEMRGIARDMDKMKEARDQQQEIISKDQVELNRMLDIPAGHDFNVKSSLHMKALFKLLGCGDLKSQDEKNLKKARYRHPLNARILNKVLSIRKSRTLISNYLTVGKEFYPFGSDSSPRFLYSLNPHGTDSSRLASKAHHFWAGDNIQKIPRGKIVKQTFKADPGFMLCEVDLEQAESRDTGYISGDPTLINNVENSPDFHKSNASGFFGVPFEEVTKELRQLGKPVNHGANYNMGPYVLIDTMGEEKIVLAKQLLGLPRFWTYIQVAEHLLDQFHKLYPMIKEVFYKGVVDEIVKTKMLTSLAVHWSWDNKSQPEYLNATYEAAGVSGWSKSWTRYCFSDPTKSKPALNSYISHPPQSLNAQTLNKSFMYVFHDIALNPKHRDNFKLLAQIHDSIFFQYRIGSEYLIKMVEERMEIPVTIKGYDGQVRTFVVPAGAKYGQHLEGDKKGKALYWSETE